MAEIPEAEFLELSVSGRIQVHQPRTPLHFLVIDDRLTICQPVFERVMDTRR